VDACYEGYVFLPLPISHCYVAYFQLQKLGHLLRVGGSSTTEMHGQIMQLVARAAVKVLLFNDYLSEIVKHY